MISGRGTFISYVRVQLTTYCKSLKQHCVRLPWLRCARNMSAGTEPSTATDSAPWPSESRDSWSVHPWSSSSLISTATDSAPWSSESWESWPCDPSASAPGPSGSTVAPDVRGGQLLIASSSRMLDAAAESVGSWALPLRLPRRDRSRSPACTSTSITVTQKRLHATVLRPHWRIQAVCRGCEGRPKSCWQDKQGTPWCMQCWVSFEESIGRDPQDELSGLSQRLSVALRMDI